MNEIQEQANEAVDMTLVMLRAFEQRIPELATITARVAKATLTAYLHEGFSREEAILLISQSPLAKK